MAAGTPLGGGRGAPARRVGLAVAGCWLAPCALSALSDAGTPVGRYVGNIASLLFAPLFVLLATAAGDWLLERVLRLRGAFCGRCLFAAAVGLGAFSLGTLGVGVIGLPPTLVVWGFLLVLAALLAARTGRLLAALGERTRALLASRRWLDAALLVIMLVLLMLNVLRAFVPPLEYDEMEYHLGAPARYVRAGSIYFIADNAYASFPANVEMLFLDAMVIRGGVVEGFALGRLMNVALVLLAACAVGAVAAELFDPRAAVPAAAILYTWPRFNNFSHVGWVEPGLMLCAALAILAAWRYRRLGRRLPDLVLLGVLCGLAAGCKYPALLFVWVPAGIWVLVSAGRKSVAHGALFAVATLVTFSPWLVRNAVNAGNPVYPLLGRVFSSPTWSARKTARWDKAHRPRDYTIRGMWRAVGDAVLERHPDAGKSPPSMSALLVLFVPLAFVRRGWRARAGGLLALVALCVVGWLLVTHRIPRFLVPWLLPLAAVSGAGVVALRPLRLMRAALGVVLVVLAALEAYAISVPRMPSIEVQMFLGRHDAFDVVEQLVPGTAFVNALPKRSRTLCYGEARALYFTGDVITPVVFDENPLDEIVRAADSPEAIRRGLDQLGVTHLFVNLAELHRLQWSYAFRYAGREWHGYCTLFDDEQQRERFRVFLEKYTRIVFPARLAAPWKRFVDTEWIAEMDQHDEGRRPVLPQELLRRLPPELLPKLPPDKLRALDRDVLTNYILGRLRFVVYALGPGN